MNGIYGHAATGLRDAGWAVNEQVARIGASGEQKTAGVLDGFAARAAVLHDLRVPIPGFRSNIDHIVVSGKRVLIIDSKVWKPGFYWTLFGVNRRGFERVDHTAKDQSYVHRAMAGYLKGTGAKIGKPVVAVWPSRQGHPVTSWLLTVPGAHVVPAAGLASLVKDFTGKAPADPVIVNRLRELLVRQPAVQEPPYAAAAGDEYLWAPGPTHRRNLRPVPPLDENDPFA